MLYQKILTGDTPFQLMVGHMEKFAEHRHTDIEFSFCLKGSFNIVIDKKTYCLQEGDIALCGPMVAHEIPVSSSSESCVLTVILGPSFLKNDFSLFSRHCFSSPVCNLNDSEKNNQRLRKILLEIVSLNHKPGATTRLLLTGYLYQVCAYLTEKLSQDTVYDNKRSKDLHMVANIEKAMELIYQKYNRPLTIEEAASVTGYGKSNFCKIFKKVVGCTFHNALNKHRIEKACILLTSTSLPVSDIANRTGFEETKTFCRVFKSLIGKTPVEYRKSSFIQ